MNLDHGRLEQIYNALVRAACEGRRCPTAGELPPCSQRYVRDLARQGIIEIQISGQNYRTVRFLTGPHAGKTTAPDPSGQRIWRIIGVRDLNNGEERAPAYERRNPVRCVR